MSDYSIEEFCDRHDACAPGRVWAVQNCGSMQEVWAKIHADWLLWVATRPGVLTDKELRLFVARCIRHVEFEQPGPWIDEALDLLDRQAKGEVIDEKSIEAKFGSDYPGSWFIDLCLSPSAIDAADEVMDCLVFWAVCRPRQDIIGVKLLEELADYLRKNTKPNFAKPELDGGVSAGS